MVARFGRVRALPLVLVGRILVRLSGVWVPAVGLLGVVAVGVGAGTAVALLGGIVTNAPSSGGLGIVGQLPEVDGIDGGAEFLDPPPADSGSAVTAPKASTISDGAAIPATMLAAYRHAADQINGWAAGCHLPVALLAAIGKVESDHAHGGDVDGRGNTRILIFGPTLDGTHGTASVLATDGGRWTGDPVWDHAMGPMQFLPSSWKKWGVDGNGDGTASPHNVYDATLTAARYLCAAGGDLVTSQGVRAAILAYNPSEQYLWVVLAWMRAYAADTVAVPDMPWAAARSRLPPPTPPQPGSRPAASSTSSPPRPGEAAPSGQPSPSPSSSPLPTLFTRPSATA